MKLKVAIADEDKNYIAHFINCVQINYFEQMELSTFTSQESLEDYLQGQGCDVLLYTSSFRVEDYRGVRFVLSEKREQEEIDGIETICKYQKMEYIYKRLLNAYAESKDSYKLHLFDQKTGTRIVTFISGAGGSGKSLCAAGFSYIQAMSGKRVLYLSTETLPSTQEYFTAEGGITLSQVFFAVKRSKGNIPMKIESALQLDRSGVSFFQSGENPLELLEITSQDWEELMIQLIAMKKFDVIVVDTENALMESMGSILSLSDVLVTICGIYNSDISKCQQLFRGIQIRGKQKKEDWLQKTCIIFNRDVGRNMPSEIDRVPVAGTIAQLTLGMSGEQNLRMLAEGKQAQGLYRLS